MDEQNDIFPPKLKVIIMKVKIIILWIWKGYLDSEGALLHSLP